VDAAVSESRLLVQLEHTRLEQAAFGAKEGGYVTAKNAPLLYAELLRSYGVDPVTPEAAAARVRNSRLREALLAALDDWGRLSTDEGERQSVAKDYVRIDLKWALPHHNLGIAHQKKGPLDEAIAEYREAIRIKKDDALAHYNLSVALQVKGRLDEAITELREAIRIKKDFPEAYQTHYNPRNWPPSSAWRRNASCSAQAEIWIRPCR
jgi:tetratricopeptide (TPR) repeat protein